MRCCAQHVRYSAYGKWQRLEYQCGYRVPPNGGSLSFIGGAVVRAHFTAIKDLVGSWFGLPCAVS
jgi:hypothetical protein